jgi:biofilm PGA synthesis N-glycosyltransferase PgaC
MLIAQTDGDCRVQPDWLKLLELAYSQSQAKFISGPVCLEDKGSFFGKMQVVEFASLIGTGAAAIGLQKPNMCNGANLAFEKAAFFEVEGYAGNETIASGDDEFLMHKIHRKFPGGVAFLKAAEATVFTPAQATLKSFLQQRIRWASKWKFYRNVPGQILAFLIFAVNAGLLIGIGSWLFGNTNSAVIWPLFIIKSGADVVFLGLILSFYRRLSLLVYFLPLQLVYIPYVVYCALAGLKGNYQWKGRQHRNP